MIEIRELKQLDLADLERVASGYISDRKYDVFHSDTESNASIELRLISIPTPYSKKYAFDDEILAQYIALFKQHMSFGAYDGELLIGVLIGEVRRWDQSVWIHEFHVAESHRRAGTGMRLMERVLERALAARARIIVCETQNTNVPTIEVYRKLGFRIEGIDISHYGNTDYPDGEIAIFMKRRLIYP